MKRKLLMIILTLTLALCSILGLTACGHEHSYTTSVTAPTCTEQGYTTYTCSCGDSYVGDYVDVLDHDFKDYIYNNDAKCEQDGTETAICDNGCGEKHTRTKEGSSLEHSYTNYVYNNDAKCEVNGTETAICNRDNCDETNTRTKNNSALNHNYGMPSYTWNGDKCTAIRICANDNTHKEIETVTAEYVKDTNATCLVAEKGHYKATFNNIAFEIRETEENSVVNGEPLKHNFGTPTYKWNDKQCTATRVCLRDNTHVETETVTAVYVKDTDVTCDAPETGHYKATFGNSAFTEQNTEKDGIENGCALNHDYNVPIYTWKDDKCTAKRVCKNDITHVESETVTGTYKKDTEVTCTEPEKGHYIAMFVNSAFTMQTTANNSVDNGVKLGHSFIEYTYNNNATCEENGTETAICSRDNCDEPYTREKANTKLGHTYGTPVYTWNGNQCTATRICGRDNTHVDTETVTGAYEKDTDATCTAPEKGHYVATFTNVAFTTQTTATNSVNKGEKLGHSFTDYNYNNNATCTENGTETATCDRNNCNETDTKEKPDTALGHAWKNGNCTFCGETELLMELSNDNQYYIVNSYGVFNGKSLSIPSEYKNLPVTKISSYAFYNCTSLTSIEIPDSVTSIGEQAFSYCTAKIIWGDNPTITEIGDYAFAEYKGTSITIPNSVKSIGYEAFYYCTSLTSIVIPDSVTSIGEYAFSGCSSLTSITLPFLGAKAGVKDSDTYQYPFGYIFGESNYTGSYSAKQYYYGSSTSSTTSTRYYIPSSLKSVTVTGGNILRGAFYNCTSLTSIEIPDSVTSIGEWTFYNCDSLTSIEIPYGVTSIGEYVFSGCSSLQYNFQNGLKYLGNSTNKYLYLADVGNTAITTAKIDSNCRFIGSSAFEYCRSLTSVVIGDSVISIGNRAFYYCTSLTSIEILDSATSIGDSAFEYCGSLTSVVIGDSATSIGNRAFFRCSLLTSVVIGDSVTSIGGSAFEYCGSLESVVIGDSVTSIGDYAFYWCDSLTSVVIGDSVTSIGDYAFSKCHSLTSIKYCGSQSKWRAISKGYDWDLHSVSYTITYNYTGE